MTAVLLCKTESWACWCSFIISVVKQTLGGCFKNVVVLKGIRTLWLQVWCKQDFFNYGFGIACVFNRFHLFGEGVTGLHSCPYGLLWKIANWRFEALLWENACSPSSTVFQGPRVRRIFKTLSWKSDCWWICGQNVWAGTCTASKKKRKSEHDFGVPTAVNEQPFQGSW